MKNRQITRLKTIGDFHQLWKLSKPRDPLFSIVDYKDIDHTLVDPDCAIVTDYYSITIKRDLGVKVFYGQESFDFDNGVIFFMAPNQVFRIEKEIHNRINQSGYIVLIHPDYLWNTSLLRRIAEYDFFHYSMHEALFLSQNEEQVTLDILDQLSREYQSNNDAYSRNIIVSQIETLLNYSERFYQRQFVNRNKSNHRILQSVEDLLNSYFRDNLTVDGLPTVKYLSDALYVSPNYMAALLKKLTGKSTQQHIQDKIIEKAKERLSSTELTVSEIAFGLGFEHSQSFNKFFKAHTSFTPSAFRNSFS